MNDDSKSWNFYIKTSHYSPAGDIKAVFYNLMTEYFNIP